MYINRRNLVGGVTGSAQSLGSAAAIASVPVFSQVMVRQLQFKVKTAMVSTGTPVLTFYARTLPGVTGSQVTLGAISFVAASAVAGALYKKDITPVNVPAGWFIEAVVSTATAGGGAAGDGWIGCIVEDQPEVDTNNSLFVTSA